MKIRGKEKSFRELIWEGGKKEGHVRERAIQNEGDRGRRHLNKPRMKGILDSTRAEKSPEPDFFSWATQGKVMEKGPE